MFGIADKVLAYVAGGLAAVLALALLAVTLSKNAEISRLNKAVDQQKQIINACNMDKGVLKANQAVLENKVRDQNASIDALTNAAATRYANGAKDRSSASFTVSNANAKAAKLAKATAGVNPCMSANELITESLK